MQLFAGGDEFAKKKDIANPNLIAGSKDFTGSKWFNLPENVQKDKYLDFTAICDNWAWNGISQYIAVNKGETFTFSAYAKGNAGFQLNLYVALNSNGEGGYKQVETNPSTIKIMATGDWQKVSFTFTTLGSGTIKPRLEGNGTSPFWFAGMKLERGTVATPWCPAYEDYAMKSDQEPKVLVGRADTFSIAETYQGDLTYYGGNTNITDLPSEPNLTSQGTFLIRTFEMPTMGSKFIYQFLLWDGNQGIFFYRATWQDRQGLLEAKWHKISFN